MSDRQTVQLEGVGDVSRVRRNRVLQERFGRDGRPVVIDVDRVPEGVARVDSPGRTGIDDESGALRRKDERNITDDIAGRIIDKSRIWIVRGLIDDTPAHSAHEGLV